MVWPDDHDCDPLVPEVFKDGTMNLPDTDYLSEKGVGITPAQLMKIARQCAERFPDAILVKGRPGIGNLCVMLKRPDCDCDPPCLEYMGYLDLRFGEFEVWGDEEEARS